MFKFLYKKFCNKTFRFLILIVVVLLVFGCIEKSFSARAFSNQINIFPSVFSLESTDVNSSWSGAENAFAEDLNPESQFKDFQKENSAFIIFGADLLASTSAFFDTENTVPSEVAPENVIINDSVEIPGEASVIEPGEGQFIDTSNQNNGDGTVQIIEENAVPAEISVPDAPAEIAPEITPTPEAPVEVVPETAPVNETPTEVLPAPAPEPTPDSAFVPENNKIFSLADDLFGHLKNLISYWKGFDLFDMKLARAENTSSTVVNQITEDGLQGKKQSIIFSDFGVSEDYLDKKISNIQLRVSMAAFSNKPGDKLVIQYGSGSNWQDLGTYDLNAGLSNKKNGGYYLFALPIFSSWEEVADLKLKISYISDETEFAEQATGAFVDATWLEIDYEDEGQEATVEKVKTPEELEQDEIEKIKNEFDFNLQSDKTNFKMNEKPKFNFKLQKKRGLFGRMGAGLMGLVYDEYKDVQIKTKVKRLNSEGPGEDMNLQVNYLSNGEFEVDFGALPREFKPGEFSLNVEVTDNSLTAGKTITFSQDFSWGVLAFNVNKSVYLPGESAYLQMGVLDDKGHTICDARLYLEITAPDGGMAILSTDNGLVTRNEECGPDNIIDTPDYFGNYGVAGTGIYKVKLTAYTDNGVKEITDQFEVWDYVPFEIDRTGPTRIYPWAGYEVSFSIKVNEDFQGEFVEKVPSSFELPFIDGATTTDNGLEKEIKWTVDWKAGEKYYYRYMFDAPNVSPEFFLLGPLRLIDTRSGQADKLENNIVFSETRQWQIASDADIQNIYTTAIAADGPRLTTAGWITLATASSAEFTAGDKYFVYVTAGFASGINDMVDYEIRHGTTVMYTGLLEPSSDANDPMQISWLEVYDQPGTPTDINIRYRANVGTVYAMNVQIMAINLSELNTGDWAYNDATAANDNYSTTFTSKANVTLSSADGTKDWLVFGMEQVDVGAININYQGRIWDGTTGYMNYSYEGEDTAEFTSYVLMAPFQNVATNTQFSIQVRDDAGPSNQNEGSRMFVLNLDAFASHKSYYADINTTLNNSWTEIGNLNSGGNYTPTVTGDQYIFTSWINDIGVMTDDMNDRLQVNNATTPTGWSWTQVGTGDRTGNDDTDFMLFNVMSRIQIPDTGQTIDLDTFENAAGQNQVASEISMTVFSTALPSNIAPTGSFNSLAQKTDGSGTIDLSIEVYDANLDNARAKLEYFADINCAATTSDPTLNEATTTITSDYGTVHIDNANPYQIGTTSYMIISSSGSNSVNFDWSSKTDLAAAEGNYCVKLTANDTKNDQTSPATTTVTIDNKAPRSLGALTYNSKTSDTVTLNFGNQAVDSYFSEYRIFYKQGTSGVTESDTRWTDANLAYINYGGATTTTITGLESETAYVFKIWAYDIYGNKASSTEATITTSKAQRVKTIQFMAGNYSGNGTTGLDSDTDNTFNQFNFKLAERNVEILSAYLIFDAHYEAYTNGAANYTGYNLAFDTCQSPCTTNAFSGSGKVLRDDNTVLNYDGLNSDKVKLLADVTNETQLLAYAGAGVAMQAQVGFRLEKGGVANSISAANAILVITYSYDDSSPSFTNTVLYPLESNGSGDQGTRLAVQTDDCTLDSNCPTFDYKMGLYEYGVSPQAERLSDWFTFYNMNDGNAANDISVDVNIEGTDVSTTTAIHEAVIGSDQSNLLPMYFSSIDGYAENATQTMEYYPRDSVGGGDYYLLGGEVAETYIASSSAAWKTRTVSFPVSAINNGLTAAASNGTVDVYFPENGASSSQVVVKKAWFRLVSNNYNTGANTVTVSTKVGANSTSANSVYNYNAGTIVTSPSFKIIHIIPVVDYARLQSANAATPINVRVNTQNSDAASQGGMSAELMITYEYRSEEQGYLNSLKLNAGQSNIDGAAQLATTTFNVIFPEKPATKTLLAAGLYSSFLINDSDATVNTANFLLDARMGTTAPTCTNAYNSRPDSTNSYTEFYKNVTSSMNANHNQLYYTCYSNDGAGDTSGGAKMNGQLLYVYKYYNPAITALENENQFKTDGTTAIANQAWTTESGVKLQAAAIDTSTSTSLDFYFNLVGVNSSLETATPPASTCSAGTSYTDCSSKVWKAAVSKTSGRATSTFEISAVPDSATGYKWQVLSCNQNSICSLWHIFDTPANFKIDANAPTAPGNLTLSTTTTSSIKLNFGATSTDVNFAYYKIFYKQGIAGVTVYNTEHIDSNLNDINYNSAASTTISSLLDNTQYVINIWAYDSAGNKTSATEMTATTKSLGDARAKSVMFYAGDYSGTDGTNGQQSNTNQSFTTFNFQLAESDVSIKNAYILFESQMGAYSNADGNYTGYQMAFDACAEPCTATAWAGSNLTVTDNSALAYSSIESRKIRLLFDVTSEAQLAAYTGGDGQLEAQVGYRLNRAAAANSIATARATLVVTYSYNSTNSTSLTNTVVYPLESVASGDSGSRRASQAAACTKNTNCPTFAYNMEIPEYSAKLSQWFQVTGINDGNGTGDSSMNVNIQSAGVDSNTYIHEAVLGGTQGNINDAGFANIFGFTENTSDSLEIYHTTDTYYVMGGEVFETYNASSSASIKTRTVSFPLGVITNGNSIVAASKAVNVYFPENGYGSGKVDVKKAWFRITGDDYNSAAYTETISSKVGNNTQSGNYVYNINTSGTVAKSGFKFIHVIPATNYTELEAANTSNPKSVTLYATNSNANLGGVSAELMITYAYTEEENGYLTSLNLFGGQSNVNSDSQSTTRLTANSVLPEVKGTKTLLSSALLASYHISDNDGAVPNSWFTAGVNLATAAPTCTNAFYMHPDTTNDFSEYYFDVTSAVSTTDNQSYTACYTNTNTGDASAGAKMNAVWLYTYKWDAPPPEYMQNDWRWYANLDNITPTTARANQNTSVSGINLGDVLRLRMNLGVASEDLKSSSQDFKLQFGSGSDCTAIGSWTDVGGLAGGEAWRGYDNSTPTDGASLSSVVLSTSNIAATYEEVNSSAVNPGAVAVGEYGEWDWVLYNNGASASSNYCFRMIKGNDVVLDDYLSDSYPTVQTAAANTVPNQATSTAQNKNDEITAIANQAWINENSVKLTAAATDPNISEVVTLYFELIPVASSFKTATTTPAGACVYGTAYDTCVSKVWFVAPGAPGDYRTNPYIGTTSITAIPDASTGYKWQVLSCDDSNVCSTWTQFNVTTPNFKVDISAPGAPGALTLATTTATSITLNFGASTTESNFSRYRIFYKVGASGVTETDSEKVDSNLNFQNYASATSTTIDTLAAGTQYVFNIWAYDQAGNKASSSSEIVVTTKSSYTPPTGSIVSAIQKDDGSGGIDVVILVDDPDNDDTLRAKIEYVQGAACNFATPLDPTLDEADANTTATYGDPKVNNSDAYQIGTSSGYIITSPGSNYVFFDWLSKSDIPNTYNTYCLRLTVNDGIYDQTVLATKLLIVDNVAPTAPGNLTAVNKDFDSVRLQYGGQATDSSFDHYAIYYKEGITGVTENDTEHTDANLINVYYNNATSTVVSNLNPNTNYVVNIWGYDSFGNKTSASEITFKTNAKPSNVSSDYQYKSDGLTQIANGGWTNESTVILSSSAHDQDQGDLVTFYYQLIGNGSSFSSATTPPTGTCSSGTAYNSCSSKIWAISTSTAVLPADWYDENWLYRKKITINSSQVMADQTDFPILATTTDADLASNARSDGHDILFTSSNGTTKLNYERESFNNSTGALTAWVKADISSSSNTILYMYYGNSAESVDNATTTGVWGSNYKAVLHLAENVVDESTQANVHLDSSGNNNYGDQDGNNEILDYIFQSQDFDGNDLVTIGDSASLDITDVLTMDFWLDGTTPWVATTVTTVYAVAGVDTFNVPAGVTSVTVKTWGAGGAGGGGDAGAGSGGNGGGGGFAGGEISVTGGDVLNINVGAGGGGGQAGATYGGGGGGGGGYSAVSRSGTYLFIAGAGGGGGGDDDSSNGAGTAGGAGGGTTGVAGTNFDANAPGGGGGTQAAGGAGGNGTNYDGTSGGSMTGGAGGGEAFLSLGGSGGVTGGGAGGGDSNDGNDMGGGGGGGAGFFGGGGGANTNAANPQGAAGGGGGSSYVIGTATGVANTAGSGTAAGNNGDANYAGNAGLGGTGSAAGVGGNGNPGRIVVSYVQKIPVVIGKTDAYEVALDSSNNLYAYINNQRLSTTLTAGKHHVALTYNKDLGGTEEAKIFVDGVKAATKDFSTAVTSNSSDVLLGDNLNGGIDEFRVSNTARSESWLNTQYKNQSNVGTFMTFDTESRVASYYESMMVITIPESATGYKWQTMVCDDDGDCSAWDKFNVATPNFKVDPTPPTAPGSLSQSSKTSSSITLSYGTQTTETNFLEYKIFYSSSSPVTEASVEHDNTDLDYKNYNGSSITQIDNLLPNTTYYFNIWAYDLAGNKASSTQISITTNQVQSTPGVAFYTKNTRVLYYKYWTGTAWSGEQVGPTVGSGATDYIKQIRTVRSDDGGKVVVVMKTWDGTNQEWWGTVYRFAANNFVNTTQLGAAWASATNNTVMSGCVGALSGKEFFVVRDNNGGDGTLVYSWDATAGWTTEAAGPDPVAVLDSCSLVRRPGTDNYVLVTYDDDSDVGTSYYYGGSTYANSWTTWTEHSTAEEDPNINPATAYFDASDNTRGAVSYSNSTTNWNTQAKYFVVTGSTMNFGTAATSPNAWTDDFVGGEYAANPAGVGTAYFIGDDIDFRLSVIKTDISSGVPVWSSPTNGTDIAGVNMYAYTNLSAKPYALNFYKDNGAVITYVQSTNSTPYYRVLNASTDTVDAASTAIPGTESNVWTRVRTYKDPSEDELLVTLQNDDSDYGVVFWDGSNNRFFNTVNNPTSNQVYTQLLSNIAPANVNDENLSYAYTGYNSAPNSPASLVQYKNNGVTTIANQAWTNESTVKFEAKVNDVDTAEVIKMYIQMIPVGDSFDSSLTEPSSFCNSGTTYPSCTQKVWRFATSTSADYSVTQLTATATISSITDSVTGYKWQIKACDDSSACSAWVKYNETTPNFKVDTTSPSAPGALTIGSKNSSSVTLNFGSQTNETNFSTYKIFYKIGSSGVTESDTEQIDSDLGFKNYNSTTNTTVSNLASSTQYVFNIWAYDLAGNKASSTQIATTTGSGPVIEQVSYILENDDGADVNSNTSDVSVDTQLSNVYLGERMNVRFQIENTGGDVSSNKVYKIQYENQTDAAGTWVDVGAGTQISYSLGLSGSNGHILSSAKAAMNGYNWSNGTWHEGVNTTGNFSLTNGYYSEIAFAVQTLNALQNKTYRFRLYNSTDSRTITVTSYPTITTIASSNKKFSKNNVASLPTDTSDLTYYFDPEGYVDVSADDNSNRDAISSTGNSPVYMFATKHTNNTDAISVTWNGQSTVAPTGSNVILQVYKYGSPNQWVTVDTENMAGADTDFDLTATINSSLASYYGASNWTYWRVYQTSGTQVLKADYYNVAFSAPTPYVSQNHYRWRNDDGTEATATWRESEDSGDAISPTVSLNKGANIRLRMSVANIGGGSASSYAYQIEYAPTSNSCTVGLGTWVALPTDTSKDWQMVTSTNFADQANTSARFANSESYSFVTGKMTESPSVKTAAISLTEGQYSEVEYVMAATTGAVTAGTYCFRVTNNGSVLNNYNTLPILTLAGNTNNAPSFTVSPSDNGSEAAAPTNYGTDVSFTATAQDGDTGDDYYLAICKTDNVTAGNDGPPTCGGGNWCISGLSTSTQQASCNYTAADSNESLSWYAFVCDKHAGFGIAKCSASSQGTGDAADNSPFVINHPPTYTSITTRTNNQNPGSTFNIDTVSSDNDSASEADTLYYYVCTTNSATFGGCTADTVCSAIDTSSPNATCSFADVAPTPAGATTYYGFLYDSHGLAATSNSRSSSYTINNTAPSLGSLVLNNGSSITVNIKDAVDKQVSAVNISVVDINGCTDLDSATGTIYMTNVTNGPLCTADNNNCYQVNAAGCVKSDCIDADDDTATYTCSAGLKYYASPTDDSTNNPLSAYKWGSRLTVYDGSNYISTTSNQVELNTTFAMDVSESLIDFGNNLFAGDNSGSSNQTTTIVNSGNSPINSNIKGTDMNGNPAGTINVNNIEWNLVSNFNWSTGYDLTSSGYDVDLTAPKPTGADVNDIVYWGIGIPYGAPVSQYSGLNTFTVILDSGNW